MKNKLFWRGFGAGVLFASLILGISCMIRTSDSQVVSRAKKLGMVYEKKEEMVTAKLDEQETAAPDTSGKPGETPKAKKTKAPNKTAVPKQTEPAAVPTPEIENTSKDNEPDKNSSKKDNTKKDGSEKDTSLDKAKKELADEKKKMQDTIQKQNKTLVIKAGDWSSTVSSRLESMGIIKDATDFDKYLNDHGYSDSINAGSYKVSPGASYRDLAKQITGR